MAAQYIALEAGGSAIQPDQSICLGFKRASRGEAVVIFCGLLMGMCLVGTLEVFGSFAEPEHNASKIDEHGFGLSSYMTSSISNCFPDVGAEQPFYMVLFGGYMQAYFNVLVFPSDVHQPVKLHTAVFATVIIGMKGYTLVKDITTACSKPWFCLQVLGTGTTQMVTVFQALLRAITLFDYRLPTRGNICIIIGYLVVTLPYIPLVLVTFVLDIIPGSIVFMPIAFLIFAIGGCLFFLYDIIGPEETPLLYQVEVGNMVASPIAVYMKFIGEATARFYAGKGWWDSIYITWSERALGSYCSGLFHSIHKLASAVAFFL